MHSKCPCPIVSLSRTFWIIFVLYSQFRIIWYIPIGCFLCIWCLFAFFSFPELSPVLPAAALVVGIRPTPVITCCKEHSLSLKNIYFVQNLKKRPPFLTYLKSGEERWLTPDYKLSWQVAVACHRNCPDLEWIFPNSKDFFNFFLSRPNDKLMKLCNLDVHDKSLINHEESCSQPNETNNLPKSSRRILLLKMKERCSRGQKDWQPRQTR